MYRVFLERAAEKQLKQLSAKVHKRVIAAIQSLAKNPRPVGCRKLTGTDNDWRIRVGDYRVVYELMSLPDLVKAKKTQRDKDWPMIRRLVEADYFKHRERPKQHQLRFWFLELRTPELLIELAAARPAICRKLIKTTDKDPFDV